jgi:dGTPase
MQAAPQPLQTVPFAHMPRHAQETRMTAHAAEVVRGLFARYRAEPALLPEPWRAAAAGGEAKHARVIADYIAGMTDNYALDEHGRLFQNPLSQRERGRG